MADQMFVTQRPPNAVGLDINDVIEVICEDVAGGGTANHLMYGGGGVDNGVDGDCGGNSAPSEADMSMSSATTTVDPMMHVKQKAYVRIIEQPQPKALRFRYICEGRSAGSIPGVRSMAENKTFPAIQVVGYTGTAVVVVSCVTVEPPYRPHPHNLVGKDGCKKGVCTVTINNDQMQCLFSNLGIQCVKRRDVEDALKLREEIRVDPFQTGFSHRGRPQDIDLNSLRLCFQVFLEGHTKGKFTYPLKPIVSEPIYDKKATCDLLICKLSDCTSSVAGGKEVILLCDKVTKEDIKVRFYEVTDGLITWEAFGDFQPSDVHKQVAIAFKTPRYRILEIENSVKVYVQLQRTSDKATSEARPFEYLPLDSGRPFLSFKRLKQTYGPFTRILGLDDGFFSNNNDKDPGGRDIEIIDDDDDDLKRKMPSVSVSNFNINLSAGTASGGGIINDRTIDLTGGSGSGGLSPCPTKTGAFRTSTTNSEEVKQMMSAALKRRNQGQGGSIALVGGPNNALVTHKNPATKLSPIWSDLSSNCYSDAELLEDVLSEGSVNDILSGVGGDGCTVYQDLENVNVLSNSGLNTAISNTLSLLSSPGQLDALLGVGGSIGGSGTTGGTGGGSISAIGGAVDVTHNTSDILYGDASYASCYSNLEFVMNRARNAQQQQPQTSNSTGGRGGGDSLIRGALFPAVPSKPITVPPLDDCGIYGVPSNIPVHATKAALLQCRGFGGTGHRLQGGSGNINTTADIVTEMDLEQDDELLPKTVLDLFV